MEGSISRRYATALVSSASEQGDNYLETCVQELEALVELTREAADFRHLLSSPSFTAAEREKAVGAILDRAAVKPLVRRFVLLLGHRGRLSNLQAITRSVRRLADQRAGRLRAEVSVAAPMAKDAIDSLRRAMERRTGKTIEMEIKVDPSLLGGVRAQIGSQVFDGTLRAQLRALHDSLLREP